MDSRFFAGNRRKLEDRLGTGVIVLTAHNQMQRNNDMAFPFEQEANFWYLTGVESPDWHLIIDLGSHKSWLVAPHVDDVHQIFDGSLSREDAMRVSGVDAVIAQSEEEPLLQELARKHTLAYTLGDHPHKAHFDFVENPAGRNIHRLLTRIFESVRDCRKELAQLRAIKQPAEIDAMKKAIKHTIAAFTQVKQNLSSYRYEYEIEAEFDYAFKKQSARHAYDPIVAAGGNACTLHYTANSERLKNKRLVLMDVGAQYHGYAADITRTYAFGGVTKRQSEIHARVVEAHNEIISLLKPGLSVSEYQEKVDTIMQHALMDVGLIGSPDDEKYRSYFPHAISHGLGIDTHDSLGGASVLEAGMVLTVEPGIYIPEENIGVRIEDDILITENGHTNLSASLSTDLA